MDPAELLVRCSAAVHILGDVNITGNGPQALKDISMVGNNLRIDHSAAMCGKAGQSVPVSQGLPTVKINKLIVG